MGEQYAAVEEMLGGAVLEVIMEAARKGEISMVQMESLAESLGGKVLHWQRKDEGAENNEEEMKAILSDWQAFGDLKKLTRLYAVQKLAELLRSSTVGQTTLAERLTRYVSIAGQDVDQALMRGIIKPEDPGSDTIQAASFHFFLRICKEPGL